MKRSFDIVGGPFNQLAYVTSSKNTVGGLRAADERCAMGLSDWFDALLGFRS
ncbi:hypothetical protein [Alginatibacterium sediminis]|uniref:hypothetical protein n=1 Tax=Alginatibacterium sediminis TaxID=2164068 RepID=UPI0013149E3E|nr:hypothetical protein [Alginatibacterium sediminis]